MMRSESYDVSQHSNHLSIMKSPANRVQGGGESGESTLSILKKYKKVVIKMLQLGFAPSISFV